MSNSTQSNLMVPNLSFVNRQFRFLIGAALIAVPLTIAPETMGYWSIALLASVPFIVSAIMGWDPIYALAGKNAYVAGEEDIQQRSWAFSNMGMIDRVARLGIGALMLFSLLTMSSMQADLALTLLAIPLIVSAMVAWDPLYAALGINSFGSKSDVEVAEPDLSNQMLAELYEFPVPQRATGTISRAA